MRWQGYVIVAALITGFFLGIAVTRGGDGDYVDADRIRAELRAELEVETDRRVSEYRERARRVEAELADARDRVERLQGEIDGLVAALDGSGAEAGEIAAGIGRAAEHSLAAADRAGDLAERVRRVRESLERGEDGTDTAD